MMAERIALQEQDGSARAYWIQWLKLGSDKLRQLRMIEDVYRRLQNIDGTVDIRVLLKYLQDYWKQPGWSENRTLSLLVQTTRKAYSVDITFENPLVRNRPSQRSQSTSRLLEKSWVLMEQLPSLDPNTTHPSRQPMKASSTLTLTAREKLATDALGDVLLEVVFPTCAICLLNDKYVCDTIIGFTTLVHGDAFRTGQREVYTGSSAEGLAMEPGWGHQQTDLDVMLLHGAQLGVRMPLGQETKRQPVGAGDFMSSDLKSLMGICHGNSCLEYDAEGCPPAYARLRVTDTEELTKYQRANIEPGCVTEDHWLNIAQLHGAIQKAYNTRETDPAGQTTTGISGPAGQAYDGMTDIVPALVADGPHPAMEAYIQRSRAEWPLQEDLERIRKLPVTMVLVGHKGSPTCHQEARVSWSLGELLLISELSSGIKQGFLAFKYTFKAWMRDQRIIVAGRSFVGSYHLKTTLLHYLERTPPSSISSPFILMVSLFHELLRYLQCGNLPHYFLPECNLLETVGPDARQIALQAIQDLVTNPVRALLKCPSTPGTMYGEISPDDLVTVFHRVYTNPSCERSKENLIDVLSRLEELRWPIYLNQLDRDGRGLQKASGRPILRGLVDLYMLGQIDLPYQRKEGFKKSTTLCVLCNCQVTCKKWCLCG